jgi:hypothetical protein
LSAVGIAFGIELPDTLFVVAHRPAREAAEGRLE